MLKVEGTFPSHFDVGFMMGRTVEFHYTNGEKETVTIKDFNMYYEEVAVDVDGEHVVVEFKEIEKVSLI